MGKITHFMYVPWTGLGLYGGFRGNRWLKNRIKVFEQFVLRSLKAQTNQNFIVWCSWRYEEKNNTIVQEFVKRMETSGLRFIHTYNGVCFWDDKYDDEEARSRLLSSLHGSMGTLFDYVSEADTIYMTIQPSDDCYNIGAVEGIQAMLRGHPTFQAVGFEKGYIMNYTTKEVKEYNPKTNPPFFTIKFDKEVFIDPLKHTAYTGPYQSHEYIGNYLKYGTVDHRGFLVGTHGENISTVFNHPYAGEIVNKEILKMFGLENVEPLKISYSLRKRLMKMFPHKVQRKLRYIFGEKLYQGWYNWIRG